MKIIEQIQALFVGHTFISSLEDTKENANFKFDVTGTKVLFNDFNPENRDIVQVIINDLPGAPTELWLTFEGWPTPFAYSFSDTLTLA